MSSGWNKAQAAIALKVPMSGIPELDSMIRESRRLDVATAAMQGLVASPRSVCNGKTEVTNVDYANIAISVADALLAASVKESV